MLPVHSLRTPTELATSQGCGRYGSAVLPASAGKLYSPLDKAVYLNHAANGKTLPSYPRKLRFDRMLLALVAAPDPAASLNTCLLRHTLFTSNLAFEVAYVVLKSLGTLVRPAAIVAEIESA